jgi:hypothetical protein
MKTTKNIQMLETIAEGLEELREKVVFVGGVTTALYIDDAAAPTPTPSDDVDCVVQVGTKQEYDNFENLLRKKGFKDPHADGAPIEETAHGFIRQSGDPVGRAITFP